MAVERDFASALSHFDPADLLDALSTGIVMLDAHLCLTYANVGAQDLMAVSVNQARGRPFGDLFHDSQRLTSTLRRSLERLEPCAQHEITLRPIGSTMISEPHVVDVTVTPLEGQITGTHLLVEMSDAKRRQRISREKDLLSTIDGSRLMVRQLAHEIKNPLGGLRGAAQLLDRELPDPAQREYTRVIIGEADRLTVLVDSMIGPSRPPLKAPVNIHELCEHVIHLLRAEAPIGIVIDRDYDPSLPEGRFDRNQIIQALLNVARNALQALGERGRIILRTRVQTNASIGSKRYRLVACVQVEDNGPGVPPELHKTLFYPLVTGRSNGTGLGLAVAQDLVTRHGGIIEFESEPGRTLFTLLLPLETTE
jgi:two-component system, NtrC family, nitrogen regulation sensor histidine kinase GlnL